VNLIVVRPQDIEGNGMVILRDGHARHAIDVLKVVPGKTVRVGVLNGPFGVGTVTAVHSDAVSMHCVFEAKAPEKPRLDLLLALPRPKVLRRLWAQLAALGVGRIAVTNAERVERNYFDTHVLAEDFYRPLLIEGLQQARDTHLPTISVHKQFKILIEDELSTRFPEGRRIVAHPGSGSVQAALAGVRSNDRVLLAVGPEGGWNPFELKLLAAHGFQAFDMGGRILRTDTACVALIALVHHALAELP
jgi:16S rRNA (uracil1498-N3)-methyltransferase